MSAFFIIFVYNEIKPYMATTISDIKEMELSEVIRLYKCIHTSLSNRDIINGGYKHNIPTLNIMREIIVSKIDGTLYNEYNDLVDELGEGDFDSINRYPLVKSEYYYFKRNMISLGIHEDIKHNSKIFDELMTNEFLEEQETKEETKSNVEIDIIEERIGVLYDKGLSQSLSVTELIELRQLKSKLNGD